MIPPFETARLPAISFGEGSLARVGTLAASYGSRALLVTGARSLDDSPHGMALRRDLAKHGVAYETVHVKDEPSPALVDRAVAQYREPGVDVVLAVGGGSALDAAKAIAGLLPHGNSVLDHLEGVGRGVLYEGPATPWIAVPTTAGTGTEATRNAVLSRTRKRFLSDARISQLIMAPPHRARGALLYSSCRSVQSRCGSIARFRYPRAIRHRRRRTPSSS